MHNIIECTKRTIEVNQAKTRTAKVSQKFSDSKKNKVILFFKFSYISLNNNL